VPPRTQRALRSTERRAAEAAFEIDTILLPRDKVSIHGQLSENEKLE